MILFSRVVNRIITPSSSAFHLDSVENTMEKSREYALIADKSDSKHTNAIMMEMEYVFVTYKPRIDKNITNKSNQK